MTWEGVRNAIEIFDGSQAWSSNGDAVITARPRGSLIGLTLGCLIVLSGCSGAGALWEPWPETGTEGSTVASQIELFKIASQCRPATANLPDELKGLPRSSSEAFRALLPQLRKPITFKNSGPTQVPVYVPQGKFRGDEVGYVKGPSFEFDGPAGYIVVDNAICHFLDDTYSASALYSDGRKFIIGTHNLESGRLYESHLMEIL